MEVYAVGAPVYVYVAVSVLPFAVISFIVYDAVLVNDSPLPVANEIVNGPDCPLGMFHGATAVPLVIVATFPSMVALVMVTVAPPVF